MLRRVFLQGTERFAVSTRIPPRDLADPTEVMRREDLPPWMRADSVDATQRFASIGSALLAAKEGRAEGPDGTWTQVLAPPPAPPKPAEGEAEPTIIGMPELTDLVLPARASSIAPVALDPIQPPPLPSWHPQAQARAPRAPATNAFAPVIAVVAAGLAIAAAAATLVIAVKAMSGAPTSTAAGAPVTLPRQAETSGARAVVIASPETTPLRIAPAPTKKKKSSDEEATPAPDTAIPWSATRN
jgi:hypothetical protein